MKRWALVILTAAFIPLSIVVAYRLTASTWPPPTDELACSVLVLGYPTNADGSVSDVARFRVEQGIEVYRQQGCTELVFSGAAVRNDHIEAKAMAVLAKRAGVPEKNIIVEQSARSTWENVGCAASLLPPRDRVFLVSDSLHAKRAQRYACRQDATLCETFIAAGAAPPATALWSYAAALKEFNAYARDLLFYRSGAVENSPGCAV
ncbi:MAG: YdcF family protein [Pseudomonadota bacterium]